MAWPRRVTSLLLVASLAIAAALGAGEATSGMLDGEPRISAPSPTEGAPLGAPLDACETEKSESETESGETLDTALHAADRWACAQVASATSSRRGDARQGTSTDSIAAHAPRGPPPPA